jgi:hypothetical protein
MCRSCYIDRGLQSIEIRKVMSHCEHMEMNEMVMNVNVDTEGKDYLPYPGGAYEDDDEPP